MGVGAGRDMAVGTPAVSSYAAPEGCILKERLNGGRKKKLAGRIAFLGALPLWSVQERLAGIMREREHQP